MKHVDDGGPTLEDELAAQAKAAERAEKAAAKRRRPRRIKPGGPR